LKIVKRLFINNVCAIYENPRRFKIILFFDLKISVRFSFWLHRKLVFLGFFHILVLCFLFDSF
jgi:hypothetical protein